jgi:hypothetical protein
VCSSDNTLRRTDLLRRPGTAQRAVGTNNMYKYGQISHYVLATVADDERVGRINHHPETLFTSSSRRYWQDLVTVIPLVQSILISDYFDDIRRPWSHDKIGQTQRLCDYPIVIQVKQ